MLKEDGIVTGLSVREDGRPVVIVGVSLEGFDPQRLGEISVDLSQFEDVDLRRGELIVMVGPSQSALVGALSPIIGANTRITYEGAPAAKA